MHRGRRLHEETEGLEGASEAEEPGQSRGAAEDQEIIDRSPAETPPRPRELRPASRNAFCCAPRDVRLAGAV